MGKAKQSESERRRLNRRHAALCVCLQSGDARVAMIGFPSVGKVK